MNIVISLLNGVTFGALLFLVSSGFTIIFGFMRVLNLAHGAFYMWGGLIGAGVYERTGSFILGLVGGALAVGVFGWIAEITLFRRVRLMPVREVLLTLGLGLVMGDSALAVFGGDPKRAAAAIKAKVTVIVATQDHMVNPGPAREFAGLLKASIVELNGDCGHLSTGCEAPKVAAAVATALR